MANEEQDIRSAQKAGEAMAKKAVENLIDSLKEPTKDASAISGPAKTVDQIKEAQKNTKEMQNNPHSAEARMRELNKEHVSQDTAKEHMQSAYISPYAKEVPWLVSSPTEFQYNPDAMMTVSRIASQPPELQNDPHYLLSEGAKLFWSTDWSGLSKGAQDETREILHRIQVQVEKLRATHPDFDIQQEVVQHNLENKKEHKREEASKQRTNVGTDLFAGIREDLPPALQKKVDDIISVLNSPNIEDGVTGVVCENYVHELRSQMQNSIGPEESMKYAQVIDRLQERLQQFRDDERIPSTIMLTRKEVQRIIKDPLGYLESMANDIEETAAERGFDSAIIEQRMNRYRLITDYFISDAYDAEKGLSFDTAITPEEHVGLQTKRKELLRTKADILDQYTDRLHGIEFLYYLSQVRDFEKDTKFIQLMDRIGERGAFGMRTQYGGLAEVALQKMNVIHADLVEDPKTAKRLRSLPEMMEDVRRRTAQKLLEEEAIWKPQYQAYLDRLVGDQKRNIPDAHIVWNQSTCDAISRSAEASYMMFFEKERVMMRGLNPTEASIDTNVFQTFITEGAAEKISAAFRIRDWHFRKWGMLRPGERAVWNQRAKMYVQKDPELRAWVDEKTDKLWDQYQIERTQWEKLAKNGTDDDYKEIKKSSLFKTLKRTFGEYEKASTELIPHQEKDIYFMLKLKKDLLHKYVTSDVGGEWAQMQGARCYGYWESGPRRQLVRDQLKAHPLFKEYLDPSKDSEEKDPLKQKKRSIFLGGDIFEAQREYFHAGHRTAKDRMKFMGTLDNAVKYRPHTFIKMRQMENEVGMGDKAGKILKEANSRFGTIQARLMLAGQKPIDYSTSYDSVTWTDGQRAIISDEFALTQERTIEGKKEPWLMTQKQYLEQMKLYYDSFESKHYSGMDKMRKPFKKPVEWDSKMGEFAHIRYAPAFSFVLWTDDIPMAVLENKDVLDMGHVKTFISPDPNDPKFPNIMQELEKYNKKFVPLSRHSTLGGIGASGEWRRAWGDMTNSISLLQPQIELLRVDEKEFVKNLTLLVDKVSTYQGREDAAKSALEAIAGWLGGAKTKQEYTEVLKGLKNSSEFKQWWGDKAKSLGLGEVSELFDELELLRGKFSEVPEFEEAVKDFLGITRWRHAAGGVVFGENGLVTNLFGAEVNDKLVESLNERFPNLLYLSKTKYAFGFLVVLLLLFAADQAKKGTEGADKKSH